MCSYVDKSHVQAKPCFLAVACGSTRVRQREAYRAFLTICVRLRPAISRFLGLCLVTLSCMSLSSIHYAPSLFRPIEPRNTPLRSRVVLLLIGLLSIRLSAFNPLTPRLCRHCVPIVCFIDNGATTTSNIACSTTERNFGSRRTQLRLFVQPCANSQKSRFRPGRTLTMAQPTQERTTTHRAHHRNQSTGG